MFAGLTTLRKLCNHPDLVTNEYSLLVAPSNQGKKEGSTHKDSRLVEGEKSTANEEEKDGEFIPVEAATKLEDES